MCRVKAGISFPTHLGMVLNLSVPDNDIQLRSFADRNIHVVASEPFHGVGHAGVMVKGHISHIMLYHHLDHYSDKMLSSVPVIKRSIYMNTILPDQHFIAISVYSVCVCCCFLRNGYPFPSSFFLGEMRGKCRKLDKKISLPGGST